MNRFKKLGISMESQTLVAKDAACPKIPPYAKKFIECKARQLVGTCGVRKGDVEDIEQELYLALFERLPTFDNNKAKLTTFIQRVVEQRILVLLRERCTDKNIATRMSQSLDAVVAKNEFGDGVTLGQTLCDQKSLPVELAAQVQLAMESLPEPHQTVCRMLLDNFSITEVAAELDMPRTTLRDFVLRDIRQAFDFLDPASEIF